MNGYPDQDPAGPVLARARGEFVRRFGHNPAWAAAAPGRINLIGEHTDYTGGLVLPMAIDRVCVAVGGPAADQTLSRFATADLDAQFDTDLRTPVSEADRSAMGGQWHSYAVGVAAEFRDWLIQRGGDFGNLDVVVASSVPVGSGLSSSASLEVAVATMLEAAAGATMDPREKALLCQRAEHRYAGVPCGIMDQFASVLGQRGHAVLIDCRSQETTAVPMPAPSDAVVVVMNSGVHHALASGEYAKRRAACTEAEAALGLGLRDATLDLVDRTFRDGDPLLSVARHVVTENERVRAASAALAAGDLGRFGRLMIESHQSLRDDYRVSCTELDALVDAACAVPGVYGARMTGGGFGGCAIALCRPEAVAAVIAAAERVCRTAGAAFPVYPSDGARPITPAAETPPPDPR